MKKSYFLITALAIIFVPFLILKAISIAVEKTDFSSRNNQISLAQTPPAPTFNQLLTQTLNVPEQYRLGVFSSPKTLNLPEGFEVAVYYAGLVSPRAMVIDQDNNIWVTDKGSGKVLLIKDDDNTGSGDLAIEIDGNLRNPHGIDLYNGDLYVGEEHQIVVYRSVTDQGVYSSKEILIPNLPLGQGHSTRTVKVGPDEKIYVAIGSSCNLCDESDERRAAIIRYNLDGSLDKIVAQGLRNTVDFVFQGNNTGFELWGVDNGRDNLGDNLPSEEVNIVNPNSEPTQHFGWPYCYGSGVVDPSFPDRGEFCRNSTQAPRYELQAHSAPLGLTFIPGFEGFSWPAELDGDLLVAFHGSWNRSVPTGYKLIRIDSQSFTVHDFITGWFANGAAWGRPVDVEFNRQGQLFISDDSAGAIYRVSQRQ